MYAYLIQGILLGFSAGASPGPFQAYLFSQTLNNGWKRTLLAAFAPLISDGPIIFLVIGILTQMPQWFLTTLQVFGGLNIIYLAWKTYLVVKNPPPPTDLSHLLKSQSLLEATIMNVLNPNPYIFWSTILGPLLLEAWNLSHLNSFFFLFGFYGAMIGFSMSLIFVFGKVKELGTRTTRILNGLSGLVLLLFGLYQVINVFNI